MNKGIYCQIKDLEISVVRLIFNNTKNKLSPPTMTQARIMDYLIKNKNKEIYQKDLEKELNLRRATVSEVLATMEKKSLITKEQNPHDARSKKIVLLEPEEKKHQEAKENVDKIEKILTTNLSEEELRIFSLTLKKMQENLKTQYNKQGGQND